LREIRAAAASAELTVGSWVGESIVSAARAAVADAGVAERALLRALIEAKSAGCGADDNAGRALVDELIDNLPQGKMSGDRGCSWKSATGVVGSRWRARLRDDGARETASRGGRSLPRLRWCGRLRAAGCLGGEGR
jgi:hypothetical protein